MNQSNDSGLNLDHLEALSNDELIEIGHRVRGIEESDSGGYFLPITFGREVERAVLARRAALANQPAPTVPDSFKVRQDFLDWNRAKSDPAVKIGREYAVAEKLMELMAHQPAQEQAEKWRHAANEWADTAYNGLQHLRNIEDGITEAKAARENMEKCCQHASAVAEAAATLSPLCGAQHAESGKGEFRTCCDHPDCTTCAGRGGFYRMASKGGV